jgi:hypothetical protein
MSNYTILQRNILDSLAHEEAKAAFLRAQEQPINDQCSYVAEKIAREVDQLCDCLKPAIANASIPFAANNDVQSDLLSFMLTRHWHWRISV